MQSGTKTRYAVQRKISDFYTGGTITLEPESSYLACPNGKQLNVVDLETNNVIKTLAGDSSTITAAACANNGNICFALESGQVYAYEKHVAQGSPSWDFYSKWRCPGVQFIAWDSSGTMVATACLDNSVKVYNAKGGYCSHNFIGHSGIAHYCWFHPTTDKFLLFSCSKDNTIRAWDLVDKSARHVLSAHYSPATSLGLLDEWTLVSCGRDRVICVWDLRKFSLIKTVAVFEELEGLLILPETVLGSKIGESPIPKRKKPNQLVLTVGTRGLIRVWDVEAEKEIFSTAPPPTQIKIEWILHDARKKRIIYSTAEQNIVIRENKIPFNLVRISPGWNDDILDIGLLDINAPGSHVVLGTNSNQIRILSLNDSNWTFLDGHKDTVVSIAISADHRWIASASKDNSIRFWNTDPLRKNPPEIPICSAIALGHVGGVTAVCWPHLDNSFVLSVSTDCTLKMWNMKNLPPPGPDGIVQLMVSGATKAHTSDVNCVAISPDDKIYATGSLDKTIKLWEFNKKMSTFVSFGILRGHTRSIWHVAFSPVDKVLASSSTDEKIKLWSLTDFTCIRTFQGHSGSVLRVAYISLGSQLLSAAADGLVKLWNVKDSECIGTFESHTDKIWTLQVSKDEKTIVTGGSDSLITIWEDRTESDKLEKLKNTQDVILSQQELSNLLHAKDYRRALNVAFNLNQPRKIFEIFQEVIADQDPISLTPFNNKPSLLSEIISHMPHNHVEKLFEYLREWNTNGKYAMTSQIILAHILKTYTTSSLMKVPDMRLALQALIPYTTRHQQRVNNFIQQSFIIDFTLSEMNVLTDEMAEVLKIEEDRPKPYGGFKKDTIPKQNIPSKTSKKTKLRRTNSSSDTKETKKRRRKSE